MLAKDSDVVSRSDLANNKYAASDPRLVTINEVAGKGDTPVAINFQQAFNAPNSPWLTMIRGAVLGDGASVDKDNDHIVTVTEIAVYLTDRAREWSDADTDHDGTISESEAQGAPTIRSIFSTADQDHDGTLRRQEHERWAQTSLMQNVDLPVVVPNIINKKF